MCFTGGMGITPTTEKETAMKIVSHIWVLESHDEETGDETYGYYADQESGIEALVEQALATARDWGFEGATEGGVRSSLRFEKDFAGFDVPAAWRGAYGTLESSLTLKAEGVLGREEA